LIQTLEDAQPSEHAPVHPAHQLVQQNLDATDCLHVAYYNLCRVHQSLGVTPAMAAGIPDRPWNISELIGLLESAEATPRRGSYVKTRERKSGISD
jgi:hypothetical protein